MKKKHFIIIILLMLMPWYGQAQNIRGEIITGFNLTQVDGDEVVGYKKIGAQLGAGAILPLGKSSWLISIETLFNQKGSFEKYPVEKDTLPLPYYNLRLNYAEVPLLIYYNDKDQLTFGAGVSYGRLTYLKEIEHGKKIDWKKKIGPYKKDDWNIIVNIRLRLYKGLHCDFRYSYSMSRIRTRTFINPSGTWSRGQFNNMLSFRVVYVFNEKKEQR